jgi:3-phytase
VTKRTIQLLYTSVGVGTLILATALVLSHRSGPRKTKSAPNIQEVIAAVETEPVSTGGDSADDPTLWVNPADAQLSLVIGTNKKRGLAVYDLSGKEIQFLPDGEMNNVDSRDDFPLAGKKVPLVTASNRSNNSIAIYKIDVETRRLESVAAGPVRTIEAYGACMYHSSKTGRFYYFGTSKQGVVEQYELFDAGEGHVSAKKVRQINVGSQLEGCVADDELGFLYVGEEEIGIWKYQAEPDATLERTKVDGVSFGGNLVADIEGLTIAYGTDGKGYLIASSQGNSTFAVYRREGTNAYVKSFRIVAGTKIDRVTETDGIHVTTANLGPLFPKGVFIAQDGSDNDGKQNFKLVPWNLIVE